MAAKKGFNPFGNLFRRQPPEVASPAARTDTGQTKPAPDTDLDEGVFKFAETKHAVPDDAIRRFAVVDPQTPASEVGHKEAASDDGHKDATSKDATYQDGHKDATAVTDIFDPGKDAETGHKDSDWNTTDTKDATTVTDILEPADVVIPSIDAIDAAAVQFAVPAFDTDLGDPAGAWVNADSTYEALEPIDAPLELDDGTDDFDTFADS